MRILELCIGGDEIIPCSILVVQDDEHFIYSLKMKPLKNLDFSFRYQNVRTFVDGYFNPLKFLEAGGFSDLKSHNNRAILAFLAALDSKTPIVLYWS